MTDPLTAAKSGVVEDAAILDLTTIKTPDELARITAIKDAAVLLVPESLGAPLASIPMHDVATIVPVPDGARVRTHNVGAENSVLVVTGVLVVTSPVEAHRLPQTSSSRARSLLPGAASRRWPRASAA